MLPYRKKLAPKYHTYLAWTLATAYGSFGDYRKALEVAENAFQIATTCAEYETISDAALKLGMHRNRCRDSLSRAAPGSSKSDVVRYRSLDAVGRQRQA